MDSNVNGNIDTYQELTAVPDISMERIKEIFEQFEERFNVIDVEEDRVEFALQDYLEVRENVLQMLALSYYALGLGEAGEIQGKVKKILRDNGGKITGKDQIQLRKELGDIQWYLARLSEVLGLKSSNVLQSNINKLFGRMERGTIRGSGDDR